MRRAALLLGLLLLVSLALAPAAAAQGTQSSAAVAAGTPPPPAYVLERDGTVIIGGDMVTDCESFIIGRAQGYWGEGNAAEARTLADKCQGLGVPPGDLTTGDAEAILSMGTEGQPASDVEKLPDTGGLSVLELAGLASGLALIGVGLLLRRRAS